MIYIYWAPPRQGKSYCVTAEVVDLIIQNRRDVYTNYPVVVKLKDGELYSSLVWKSEYIHQVLVNSTIIIDEAYQDFSSRDYKKFSVDMHTFFATNGHNDLDIILIAQNPARIDLIIREMCSEFVYVKKTSVPYFLWVIYANLKNRFGAKMDPSRPRPLFFTLYTYLTEKQMSSMKTDDAWQVRRVWFNERAALAYDTHYYRSEKPPFEGESWLSVLNIPEPEKLKKQNQYIETIRLWIDLKCLLKLKYYKKNCYDKGTKFKNSLISLSASVGSLLSRILG